MAFVDPDDAMRPFAGDVDGLPSEWSHPMPPESLLSRAGDDLLCEEIRIEGCEEVGAVEGPEALPSFRLCAMLARVDSPLD